MKNEEQLEYIRILKALQELPFKIGKKSLIEFLQGKETPRIIKNRLYTLATYNTIDKPEHDLSQEIEKLIINGMIKLTASQENKFLKLLQITKKGEQEINDPQLYQKKTSYSFKEIETPITQEDLDLFDTTKNFLYSYNLEQKKAITSPAKNILCIAGAGSGKTAVLIKRIAFLIEYRLIQPEKILAITFTKKAKEQMRERLNKIPQAQGVTIETFNSFAEKILKANNRLVYDKPTTLLTYKDKITLINRALEKMNLSRSQALTYYFKEQKTKTQEQLFTIFVNDCFFIRDYFKSKNKPLQESEFISSEIKHKQAISMIVEIAGFISAAMKRYGLRTFNDKLLDTLHFFENNPQAIPQYEHILVDEYQDGNASQIKLLNFLDPQNLFVVGDPRQSIYGWRGSDIRYILNFAANHEPSQVITLTKNYRSKKKIINLINQAVSHMGFKDLESTKHEEGKLTLKECYSEQEEYDYIIQEIQKSSSPIFILARTNNQLNELAQKIKLQSIPFQIKTEENNLEEDESLPNLTLATIHAIKGLEAETVFVVGCNSHNFPCKGSEHPIVEMIKDEEYDKEEEERRLFYVALSRAKSNLHLTYTKKPTYFIKETMHRTIKGLDSQEKKHKEKSSLNNQNPLFEKLKNWRKEMSQEQNLPAYCILTNKTLQEIADKKPSDFDDLSTIQGMGEVKIERYGSQILRMVQEE